MISLTLTVFSCNTQPEQLHYNKDACQSCKMTLVDTRFGAEIVTQKGRIYKFDDANCMINYINENNIDSRDIGFKLVIDYAQPEKLIDAGNAFYLKSNTLRSPMNSQVAAFESYDTLNIYKKKLKGIYLSWGELVTQFK